MLQKEFESLTVTEYGPNRTRAFLKIQDGCDRYCSYCMIPYARGHVRSKQKQEVLEEVEGLAKNGILEVVLSGIHLASYGRDLEDTTLLDLISELHQIEGIFRIRLGSLEPNCITERFVSQLSQLSKFCPQFHLSLQSGCNATLRRMNRRYTAEEYAEKVAYIRRFFPNAGITTDVMVGFAGETEDEFQQSLQFVEQIGFSQIHVFPYSIRKGTKAADFPNQVSPDEKEKRAAEMIRLGNRLTEQFIQTQSGTNSSVLIEQEISPGIFEGYTPEYLRVQIPSHADITGTIATVTLTVPHQDFITGILT